MGGFDRKRRPGYGNTTNNGNKGSQMEMKDPYSSNSNDESTTPPHASSEKQRLPQHNNSNNSNKKSSWVKEDGEAGRSGVHPFHFLHCLLRSSSRVSMAVNVLWPVVPAAIAVGFIYRHNTAPVLVFTLNYIAMIPAANMIGYAGQELGRKLPSVIAVFVETTLGSIVEIILFAVLIAQPNGEFIYVVRAAILGSILANMLLCLGCCFIAGGFQRHDQVFHEIISEVGSGLLLVAGFGLVLPSAFAASATSDIVGPNGTLVDPEEERRVVSISRATAVLLLVAYIFYFIFNTTSHHGKVSEVYEKDEQNDMDRHDDLSKKKLTATECAIALVIAIACVALIAVNLVLNIHGIVERGISDQFMGLILVPLVEKLAEHLTAIDEAYDNTPNLALSHVLGATVQTALLNTPIVVFIGWGLGVPMDLNFKQFDAIALILAILVMGNFVRDGKSNYLEGVLAVLIYVIIAICAWYYPNPEEAGGGAEGSGEAAPARLLLRAAGM